MSEDIKYIGAGGARKPRTPVITNDNLFSRDKVELLLGVGEGTIVGLENGKQSFFVGDVPLHNSDDDPNFQDLQLYEYYGSPSAVTVPFVLGGESHSTDVGVSVTKPQPVVRYTAASMRGRFNRIDLRLMIAQLYEETSGGDVLNNIAKFRIEYKASQDPTWTIVTTTTSYPSGDPLVTGGLDGTAYLIVASQVDGLNGYHLRAKTGSGFVLDFSFPVTTLTDDDYILRVTKFNEEVNPAANIKSPAEIVFDRFQLIGQATRTFKNTAMVQVIGRASDQFSSLPSFYGIFKGLKTYIPINYDPEALGIEAAYDEPWNGGLTQAWHNNPAWVLYDLLTNTRYGLAKYARELTVNLQDFYEAGKWCDTLVQKATGSGLEKRYTMNITIAENQNAWEYLQNIAGAFDGIIYDDGEGMVRLKVDRWAEPRVLFTPETINPEGFNFSYTDLTTRYNQITVSFTNPERGWEQSRRKFPSDLELETSPYYLDNGLIPLDMVAVGCTSESEAIRRAQARVLTSNKETTVVSFTTTRLGLTLDPLEIVYIADPQMGWGLTGRVETISGLTIKLRDEIVGYSSFSPTAVMYLQSVAGLSQHTVIITDPLTLVVVTDTTAFLNTDFPEYAAFSLKNDKLGQRAPKPFRITAIEPLENYDIFRISALEVAKEKYDVVGSEEDIPILIEEDIFDLNLKSYFINSGLHSEGRTYNSVTFILDGRVEQAQDTFLMVCASAVDKYALTVGDWTDLLPVGVKPKLVIKGAVRIYGRGGRGGDGGFSYADAYDRTDPYSYVAVFIGHGLSGEAGGDSTYLNYPLELELEAGSSLLLLGGYGGGLGGRGSALVYKPLERPPVTGSPIANGEKFIGYEGKKYVFSSSQSVYVAGTGGSGGYPYGAGGFSGKKHEPVDVIGVPSQPTPAGNAGTKDSEGVATSPLRFALGAHPDKIIQGGTGTNGQPTAATTGREPMLISDSSNVTFYTTTLGTPTNGAQGTGIINRGNLTIVNNGGVGIIHSDLYGLESI